MPLPKIDLPIFELQLVSQPKPIKFRPFLVKEEKLLLMALQSEDEQSILQAIKQVINNCLVEETDIDKIPIFDIEYLFLNIRARSVGERVQTGFVCRNVVGTNRNEDGIEEQQECKHLMAVEVNLLEIAPATLDVATKIYFTRDVGIQLEFPNIETFRSISGIIAAGDNDLLYQLIYDCTNYIFDENSLYYKNETSMEDFVQFLESLTQEQFDKILDFFSSLPKLSIDIDHQCEKCGFNHKLHMEGLNDFFI